MRLKIFGSRAHALPGVPAQDATLDSQTMSSHRRAMDGKAASYFNARARWCRAGELESLLGDLNIVFPGHLFISRGLSGVGTCADFRTDVSRDRAHFGASSIRPFHHCGRVVHCMSLGRFALLWKVRLYVILANVVSRLVSWTCCFW